MFQPKHLALAAGLSAAAIAPSARAHLDDRLYASVVASRPAVGDLVFIRVGGPLFSRVAGTTRSWTSHVGIIVDRRDGDWIVAESRIPFVSKTTLRRFLDRSSGERYAILRLREEPTEAQKQALLAFADSQLGRPYCLGFDLESRGTFCSKFVHEAVLAGTNQSVGDVETFDQLLRSNPGLPLWFWRIWYGGSIPWKRTTITPQNEIQSPLLRVVTQHNT